MVSVKVHSLGSADAPEFDIAIKDGSGTIISRVSVPSIKAPVDLLPKTSNVSFILHPATKLKGCKVVIDPENRIEEITLLNNEVMLSVK